MFCCVFVPEGMGEREVRRLEVKGWGGGGGGVWLVRRNRVLVLRERRDGGGFRFW